MPKPKPTQVEQFVNFEMKVMPSWNARMDAWAMAHSTPGLRRLSRADAVRIMTAKGLEDWEKKASKTKKAA